MIQTTIGALRKLIRETRYKGLHRQLRAQYRNIPDYVFNEFWPRINASGHFNTALLDRLNGLTWKLEIIEVALDDFTHSTMRQMFARKFGELNPYEVPNDEERLDVQKRLNLADGRNEPVVLEKRSDGYELLEGWHRTMVILRTGEIQGLTPQLWNTVKLRAWIGRSV